MQIVVDIADEFVQALFPAGQDPARAALEAIAIEAYREHRLTGPRKLNVNAAPDDRCRRYDFHFITWC